MSKDIKNQINRLRKEIKKHNRLYYTEGRPEISDAKYGRLMQELVMETYDLAPTFPKDHFSVSNIRKSHPSLPLFDPEAPPSELEELHRTIEDFKKFFD